MGIQITRMIKKRTITQFLEKGKGKGFYSFLCCLCRDGDLK